jgi:hypothetical protein
MRTLKVWVIGLCTSGGLVACGGGSGSQPKDAMPSSDAELPIDAAPDAAPDAMPDAALGLSSPPPCGYTEQFDVTNLTTSEETGLTVGAVDQSLCGIINTGHFDSDSNTVDTDSFRVTSDGTVGLVVRLFGAPGAALAGDFVVTIFDTAETPTLLAGVTVNLAVADHAAFPIALPAGTYDIVIAAHNPTDLAASFNYKVQLAPDAPTRCAAVTAAADYTEARDGTGTGNDVIAVAFGGDPAFQLTASPDDAAEPTGLTIGAVHPIRITGSSANEDAADDYMDRDTYLVQTGPDTNELTLRLDWADAANDLDFVVFVAGQTAETGDGLLSVPMEEYNIIPVKPATSYWVWIGSHDGSTALPATYDLSICGTALVHTLAPSP